MVPVTKTIAQSNRSTRLGTSLPEDESFSLFKILDDGQSPKKDDCFN